MRNSVPDYTLYGEDSNEIKPFWLHLESLSERSQRYGWEIAPHRHDHFFQIFTILQGGGEVFLDGVWKPVEAPVSILIPAGVTHAFRFFKDSDGKVLTVLHERLKRLSATDRAIDALLERPAIMSLEGGGGTMQPALRRIGDELANRAPGHMVLVEALFAEIAVALIRLAGKAVTRAGASDPAVERIAELMALIDRHALEHKPVGHYAERLGLSQSHLNRLAREHTGRSVQALLNARLVEAAQRELLFTHLPVKAVAFATGFSDPAYFNRFFRAQAGLSPGVWRSEERARMAVPASIQ